MAKKYIFKQQQGGIWVILFFYLVLLVIEYSNDGFIGFNWIGSGLLGVLVFLGILRVWRYGTLVIENEGIVYWNFLFQKQSIAIKDIESVDWTGIFVKGLKINTIVNDNSISRYIVTGTISLNETRHLIEICLKEKPNILLSEKLKKILKISEG